MVNKDYQNSGLLFYSICFQQDEDSVGNAAENSSIFFHNQNALVAFSKGMMAVKLCSNKILQF